MFTWMPWDANPPQAIPALLQNPCGHSQVTLPPLDQPGRSCAQLLSLLLKVGAAVPPAGQPNPGWVINSFLPMKELEMPHKINPPWPSCQGIISISPPWVVDPRKCLLGYRGSFPKQWGRAAHNTNLWICSENDGQGFIWSTKHLGKGLSQSSASRGVWGRGWQGWQAVIQL